MVVNRTEPAWTAVGGQEGTRSLWVVGDLLPGGSNYTAWVLDESAAAQCASLVWPPKKVSLASSGRMRCATDGRSGLPCPLALPNAVCPSLSYAAALDLNATSSGSPLFSLPDNLTSILTSNLEAFSTSLLSQACGRDLYSHVSSCADCFAAYRAWLCAVAVPRCASSIIQEDVYPTPATMDRNASSPRNPALPAPDYNYTELLRAWACAASRTGRVPSTCSSDVPAGARPPARATALLETTRSTGPETRTARGRPWTNGEIDGAMADSGPAPDNCSK